VLVDGELRLFLERGGRSLLTIGGEPPGEALSALLGVAERRGRLELHTVDGVPVRESPLFAALRGAGFGIAPRGVVAYGERRLVAAR
jgi:ATP-dependent Lhr-like helicase